jgi:hypothetical protein
MDEPVEAGEREVGLRVYAGRTQRQERLGLLRSCSSSAVLPIPGSPRTTSAPPLAVDSPCDEFVDHGAFRVASDQVRQLQRYSNAGLGRPIVMPDA